VCVCERACEPGVVLRGPGNPHPTQTEVSPFQWPPNEMFGECNWTDI